MPYVEERCSSCSSGTNTCYMCGGVGKNNCTSCGGAGKSGWGENSQTCWSCGGSGRATCSSCAGQGRISCSKCAGRGHTSQWVPEKAEGNGTYQTNKPNSDGCAAVFLAFIIIPPLLGYALYQAISLA